MASSEVVDNRRSEAVAASARCRSVTSSIDRRNHWRRAISKLQLSGVEEHRAPSDLRKVVRHFEIIEEVVWGKISSSKNAQLGIRHAPPGNSKSNNHGLFRHCHECSVECFVGRVYAQIGAQEQLAGRAPCE